MTPTVPCRKYANCLDGIFSTIVVLRHLIMFQEREQLILIFHQSLLKCGRGLRPKEFTGHRVEKLTYGARMAGETSSFQTILSIVDTISRSNAPKGWVID